MGASVLLRRIQQVGDLGSYLCESFAAAAVKEWGN